MPPEPIQHQLTHYTDASGTDLFGEGLWEQRAHYTARRAEIREALAPYVAPEAYALDSYEAGTGAIGATTSRFVACRCVLWPWGGAGTVLALWVSYPTSIHSLPTAYAQSC
jgi:hypothetical protein